MLASQPSPAEAATVDHGGPAQGLPPAFTSFLAPITLRLRDMTSFQLPRLAAGASGAVSPEGANDTASPSAAFAAYETELNDSLEECASLLQEGQLLLEDLCTDPMVEDTQVGWMQSEWARVTDQFQRTRSSARTELLQARRNLAERKKQGLLKAAAATSSEAARPAGTLGSEQSLRQRQAQAKRGEKQSKATAFAGDDEALLASSSLTSSLHASLSLLSDSLSQSTYSAQLLDESSASLSSLSLDYSTFSDLLKNSGSILRSMEKQDRIDALMLLGAYAFFALCVGYILKVRIWDRGIGILWFFLRMFGIVGRGGSSTTGAAPAAATATATSALKHVAESIVAAANASTASEAVAAAADPATATAATTTTSTAAEILEAVSTVLAGAATTAAAAAAAAAAASSGIGQLVGEGQGQAEADGGDQGVEIDVDAPVPIPDELEPILATDADADAEQELNSGAEEVHVEVTGGDAEVEANADADADGTFFYDAQEDIDREQAEVDVSDVPDAEAVEAEVHGEAQGSVHDEL